MTSGNAKWKMDPVAAPDAALFFISGLGLRAKHRHLSTQTPDLQGLIARQAALVTELDVNGLKVLVKAAAGSQTSPQDCF
jgi:hypothetical protein